MKFFTNVVMIGILAYVFVIFNSVFTTDMYTCTVIDKNSNFHKSKEYFVVKYRIDSIGTEFSVPTPKEEWGNFNQYDKKSIEISDFTAKGNNIFALIPLSMLGIFAMSILISNTVIYLSDNLIKNE